MEKRHRSETYLINNDILPCKLFQMCFLTQNHLVASDTHIKLFVNKSVVDQRMSLILGALEDQDVDLRSPPSKLSLPVVQRRLGHSYEMRAWNVHNVSKVA